jgi:hypothetical protein
MPGQVLLTGDYFSKHNIFLSESGVRVVLFTTIIRLITGLLYANEKISGAYFFYAPVR